MNKVDKHKNFILVFTMTIELAHSDQKEKIFTITWMVSNGIFILKEGYKVICYTDLVRVPKLDHRKRDRAPLKCVCILWSLENVIFQTSFF